MGQFNESLTVRILGDSEGLQRSLEEAARSVEDFRSRLSELSDWSNQLRESMEGIGASQGLERISTILERIQGQMVWINQTPLVINVAPALASLSVLSAALDAILMKLLMIRAMGAAGGGASGGGGGGGVGPVGEFASGEPVTGLPGIDRVPAMLTAGEFVISSPTARELGDGFLRALNESPARTLGRVGKRVGENGGSAVSSPVWRGRGEIVETSRQEITHVGGVTIHLNGDVDPESVLRQLKLQGISLRNRRG